MKTQIILYIVLGLSLVSSSCKKIEKGFLSDNPRYVNGTIVVPRGGIYVASERIDADGSTPPYSFKMSNLRDRVTGLAAPKEFFTEYDVLMFKKGEVFNAAKDTTTALLNAKRETVRSTPLVFNPANGQLVFNRSSSNLPVGEYIFDIEMTNVKGTTAFPNFGMVKIIDPLVTDFFEVTYQAATGSNASETFFTTTAPQVSCERISADGARIFLKIVDKNGVAFDPSANQVIRRGDRPTFESHVKFNPVEATDNALICDFELAPFPLNIYHDGITDWGYLIYYRIPMAYATVDGYTTKTLNVNPVFGFRVKMEGTYIVTVRLPSVTKV